MNPTVWPLYGQMFDVFDYDNMRLSPFIKVTALTLQIDINIKDEDIIDNTYAAWLMFITAPFRQ
jgi:hypothetical protein